jgi:uncharacterized delta-60 repeat protein
MIRGGQERHARYRLAVTGKLIAVALVLVRVLLEGSGLAQPASVDAGFDAGPILGGGIRAVTVQQDGDILIGGSFTNVQGMPRNGFARLKPDGRLDSTFANGAGLSGKSGFGTGSFVSAIVLQADGRSFIAGSFTNVHGFARPALARLNPDGTLDQTYIPDSRVRGMVLSLALQPDQKLLVGTDFVESDGTDAAKALLRLEPGGELNRIFTELVVGSFSSFAGGRVAVNSIIVLPDAKILVGGVLFGLPGVNSRGEPGQPGIARLHANGELDTTFTPSLYRPDPRSPPVVSSVLRQDDGKIMISGHFLLLDNGQIIRKSLARLQPDGSVDASFQSSLAFNSATSTSIDAMAFQADGKILIASPFTSIDGQLAPGLARINSDGRMDLSFNPGTGPDRPIRALVPQTDGTTLVAGDFLYFNEVPRPGIARLPVGELVPIPRARIQRTSGQVIISWPLASGEFEVETTENLGTATSWRTILAPVERVGTFQQVIVPVDRNGSFFRLRKR